MARGKWWLALGIVAMSALALFGRRKAPPIAPHEGTTRVAETRRPPPVRSVGRSVTTDIELSGRVASGASPVPRAQVFAYLGPRMLVTRADDEGRFTLRLESGGELRFEVTGADVLSPTNLVVSHDMVVEVSVGGMASIRGTVRRNGVPVEGATVHFGPGEMADAVTDEAGAYTSGEVVGGRYVVWAESDDLRSSSRRKDVVLAMGERRESLDLELDHGAEVSGTVRDEAGAPVTGVTVLFKRLHPYEAAASETDARGQYRVTRLGVGEYRAIVHPTNDDTMVYSGVKGEREQRLRLTRPDAIVEHHDLAMAMATAPLHGRVVDENGAGVAGATIEVTSNDAPGMDCLGKMRFSGREDGQFATKALPAGRYGLWVSTPAGSVTSTIDHPGEHAVLTIPASGTISGTLEGFTRPPAVWVSSSRIPVDGTHFVVERAPRGRTTIAAVAGEEMAVQTIDVQPPAPTFVTLRPQAVARLNVTVANVRPADEAFCHWAVAAGLENMLMLSADARFSVTLPIGALVRVDCNHRHGFAQAEIAELPPMGEDLRLEMSRDDD